MQFAKVWSHYDVYNYNFQAVGPAITTTLKHPNVKHTQKSMGEISSSIKCADKMFRCSDRMIHTSNAKSDTEKLTKGVDVGFFLTLKRNFISLLLCRMSLLQSTVVRQFSRLRQSLNYFQVTLFPP